MRIHWLLESGTLRLKICEESPVSDVLNPDLPLCHFLGSLARLGLGEFFVESLLGFEQSLAHFDRQLVAAGKPLPQAFLPGLKLKMFVGLVVALLMILDKIHNSLFI